MAKGKKTCKILKEIRRQIAEANDIEYAVEECQYKGDCLGTCPKCEAEVRYLEQQLHQRQLLGKAVVLAGVSVGMFTLSSCNLNNKTQGEQLTGDTIYQDITPQPKEPKVERTPENCTTGMVGPEDDGTSVSKVKSSVKFVAPVIKGDVEVLPKSSKEKGLSVEKGNGEVESDSYDKYKPNENGVYDVVEEMPTYPGGMSALMAFVLKNFKYPKEVEEEGIQGRIVCTLVVNEDGSISDINVVRSVHPLYDAEFVRVIEAIPKWNPGKHNGKPVKVKYTIPMTMCLRN